MRPRDEIIVRREIEGKIEQLRPLMVYPGWQRTFADCARYWRVRANGCPEGSEARREYNGWALAHATLVRDDRAG